MYDNACSKKHCNVRKFLHTPVIVLFLNFALCVRSTCTKSFWPARNTETAGTIDFIGCLFLIPQFAFASWNRFFWGPKVNTVFLQKKIFLSIFQGNISGGSDFDNFSPHFFFKQLKQNRFPTETSFFAQKPLKHIPLIFQFVFGAREWR